MVNIFNQLGTEGNLLNIIRAICKNLQTSTCSCERLKASLNNCFEDVWQFLQKVK
jgi:hypothetical protein